MDTLGQQEIWSYFTDQNNSKIVSSVTDIRKAKGHHVSSFLELATKIAELQFMNREYVLMFRGQTCDYLNTKRNTTLKPSLFRPKIGRVISPKIDEISRRYQKLKDAELELVRCYENENMLGCDRLKRHRILRWAILQHYEVCPTPLLDVTQSLRIATSFACADVNVKDEAFIYVLAIPNLSGAITASAEAGLQVVRLSSVCPPTALRPHIQEGYLLGEYPEMTDYEQKTLYGHYEIDFGRRLLAKFRFTPSTFWSNGAFPKLSKRALYPSSKNDPLYALAKNVKLY